MNAEEIQELTTEHDYDRGRDHCERTPTEHVIQSCVLEMSDETAIIDEQKYEYQNDREQDTI